MFRPALLSALILTTPVAAQSAAEVKFAKSVLAQVQQFTFKGGREYCGYIGYDATGKLRATSARRGRKDSCRAIDPPAAWTLIASYHSHGTFLMEADSEVPSADDVRADNAEGVDGYLVTPGGRVWFIDGKRQTARILCGRDCLSSDPNFKPEVFGKIARKYTLQQLMQRD